MRFSRYRAYGSCLPRVSQTFLASRKVFGSCEAMTSLRRPKVIEMFPSNSLGSAFQTHPLRRNQSNRAPKLIASFSFAPSRFSPSALTFCFTRVRLKLSLNRKPTVTVTLCEFRILVVANRRQRKSTVIRDCCCRFCWEKR